jgi:hypothetical protein
VSDRGIRRRDRILREYVRALPDTMYWSKIKQKAETDHGTREILGFCGQFWLPNT